MTTYANQTEKKINAIHEQMMTKEDFTNFSDGISEDLHTKATNIIGGIRNAAAKAFTRNVTVSLMMISVILWTVIIGAVATYQINQCISKLNTQLIELETQVDTLATQVEASTAEWNAKLDYIEASLDQLDTRLALVETTLTEVHASQITPVPINYGDITHKSGLTAEQFDAVIDGVMTKYNKTDTKLVGLGQALYDMESEYDINGFLALGISGIESGWGRSNLAKNANNLYGLLGMSFDSTYDCTMYFGELMRNHYIDEGRTSLASISKKYCGGNAQWVSDVTWFIGIYTDMAKEMYPI